MTTFDSTKSSLKGLLGDINNGKIQLPDFQRGWVWDDDHIRDLLVSIARSFPIGAIMLLETGGDIRFETRAIEGLEDKVSPTQYPERLILDGQQRLTTLTQALNHDAPVNTRTSSKKSIRRYYYFDIQKALDNPLALDEAIIAVDEKRQLRRNFARDVELDLSTIDLECQEMCFPCGYIMNSNNWENYLHKMDSDKFNTYMEFRAQILDSFREYHIPVISLKKETPKEAVCLVFEKVNTGGVSLSVFELVTASYAADGYNLRDDWFGSKERDVDSRKGRIEKNSLLKGTEATEFLQAMCLLNTLEQRQSDISAGKTGKQVRPVSAKRADVLELSLEAWKEWADQLEEGYKRVGQFLKKQCVYKRSELPYSTQLVALVAVMTRLGERWMEPKILDKLSRWYWCGVLGELYGGAVETRIANDYEELMHWFEDDESVPRTVRDANFHPDRLSTLRTRRSAAYKGLSILILREGARDWYWKAGILELDSNEVALDIHHIFPREYCKKMSIEKDVDCILNKTPISYKANRKIGSNAPSVYIPRIQKEEQVGLSDNEMDDLLESHALSSSLLREDKYDEFIRDRRNRLVALIEKAMGKKVEAVEEGGMYEESDEDS